MSESPEDGLPQEHEKASREVMAAHNPSESTHLPPYATDAHPAEDPVGAGSDSLRDLSAPSFFTQLGDRAIESGVREEEAWRIRPYVVDPPRYPALLPHFGHTLVFFLLTFLMLLAGELLVGIAFGALHMKHGGSSQDVAVTLTRDPRFLLAVEGTAYGLTLLLSAVLFRLWWQQSFLRGLRWHAWAAARRSTWLIATGIALGLIITIAGNYLPMPKDAPILKNLTSSQAGAWLMTIFGVTVAPLFEEIAFRGFLLPSLLNAFTWLARREAVSAPASRWIGVPVSIVLTSAPFALMHSQQLSHAWAPLLLIGVVSTVLCVVRILLDSVAASTLVHASYNLMLFGFMIVETSGFRHLEKLNG